MSSPRSWLFALVGFFAIALLALAGFVRPVRDRAMSLVVPVAGLTSSVGSAIGRWLHLDPDARTAGERISELEARLRAQTIDYVRLRALEEENRSLRAQANFISQSGYRTLGARVISRSISFQTAAVTIDRGSKDGVEIGQAVMTEDGVFVGKVASLFEHASVVVLLTDVQGRTAAAVSGGDRVIGVVEGRGNGAAHLTLIPQALPLERDQIIVTAGTEEKVPKDLIIGLVNDVESRPTDPFKNAVIEPLAPVDRLDLVSVVIPGS